MPSDVRADMRVIVLLLRMRGLLSTHSIWIVCYAKSGLVPTRGKILYRQLHSRICSLHFRDSDFVEEHCDSNTTRRKNLSSSQLKHRHLKKDAVQTIFPNLPCYLSSPGVTPRTSATAASAAGRRQQEGRRLEMLEQSFTADDAIESLTTQQLGLKERLEGESALPEASI